ncbi:hypothetical protein M409DRAFT_65088 [Zasmidium cellare ATCC 36951]|uniref:Uncharacterized protein n=1 Tax=Zasmidium cellare ATCC 36951 TaxID=1080233 RepID=A0A6A6CQP7_ZASCE|nr:uncharacterized protein M409DRAFT_65088 [Zasmidium cellare ATCC 36951]KAF2169415.1 hypothetical protein M409DRAFT_65088 [Zasmidium cellare ATCC 36951]
MAATASLVELLADFNTATDSASQGLPSSESLHVPENGITLFDARNEIFLAYLQALALRNLNVIRSIREGGDVEVAQALSNDITKKLVEHRVYLERGVRPLEQKIKYQVDRVVKAADDEGRLATQKAKQNSVANGHASKDGREESGEEDSSDDSDSDSVADLNAYQPRAAGMQSTFNTADKDTDRRGKSSEDGIYRPPRISATAMPTTESRQKSERKPGRSKTLDEYVSTELSAAPLAEPSIGSNLAAGGRQSKDTRQLREEAERRNYEETNLVRLPAMSKKELAKKGLGKARDGGFGGEEWRGLSESIDRIGDLTRRKGKDSALDKSRKRRAVEDGPRGDGIGNTFDIKRRRMQKKGQI